MEEERTEQTPEEEVEAHSAKQSAKQAIDEGDDVEGHSAKQSAKQAPAAAFDEGDDVEGHVMKQSAKYNAKA